MVAVECAGERGARLCVFVKVGVGISAGAVEAPSFARDALEVVRHGILARSRENAVPVVGAAQSTRRALPHTAVTPGVLVRAVAFIIPIRLWVAGAAVLTRPAVTRVAAVRRGWRARTWMEATSALLTEVASVQKGKNEEVGNLLLGDYQKGLI